MNRLPWLLCFSAGLSLAPSPASAADPPPAEWAKRRVEDGLVKPLAQREGGRRFTRARQPPVERRVRVPQAAVTPDKRGRGFLAFAIDVRFGGEWQKGDVVGCAYRDSGELFVKVGTEYRPAGYLLGQDVEPVAGVCEAAPPKA